VALYFLLLDCLEPCQSCFLPLEIQLLGRLAFKAQPAAHVHWHAPDQTSTNPTIYPYSLALKLKLAEQVVALLALAALTEMAAMCVSETRR
jgi:hypothetical protein